MPPMGTNMATLNGEVSQEQLEYYELRAKGGTGLITIENICIDFPFASNGTTQLRIDNDQYIPRLFKLTETLHKHGACVSIQLNHAGCFRLCLPTGRPDAALLFYNAVEEAR